MKGLSEIKKANEDAVKHYKQDKLASEAVNLIEEYGHQKVTIGDLLHRLDVIIAEMEKTL